METAAIYISLDVPEPMAAVITSMRRILEPGYAHLPVEIALAGSSGIGTPSGDVEIKSLVTIVERIARSFFPVTTRFVRSAWLGELGVHALEVDPVDPLLALHDAVRTSGITFHNDVPAAFHPHCTLRWKAEWMTPEQDRAWSRLVAPAQDFVLRDLAIYGLRPGDANAHLHHRTALGS